MDTEKLEQHKEALQAAKNSYRNISINQLSLANNLLLTLALGFLAFNFKLGIIHFDFYASINWNSCFYSCFLFFNLISIFLGICVIFSRLYDFKITRYIIKVRLILLERYKVKLKYETFRPSSFREKNMALFNILFKSVLPIHDELIQNYINDKVAFNQEFSRLRKLAKILGEASLYFIKQQAFFLFLSILALIIYSFSF